MTYSKISSQPILIPPKLSRQSTPIIPYQPIKSVLEVPAESMRTIMNDAYRLKPDKRFLLAIGEIHHFLTGAKKEETTFTFNKGRWLVRYGNTEVGTLRELPDLSEMMATLKSWAIHQQQSYPLSLSPTALAITKQKAIEKSLEKFLAPHATSVLKITNELWSLGTRHPFLLTASTKALIYLTLQGMDRTESADVFPAKALAMLALSQALTPLPLIREECLLAHTIGYTGHAAKRALLLPKNDAVREYALKNDPLLETFTKSKNSSVETKYLWLTRLSKKGETEPWAKWVSTAFKQTQLSVPVLKTGLDLNTFYGNRFFPKNVQRIILFELIGQKPSFLLKKILALSNDPISQTNTFFQLLNEVLKLRDSSSGSLIQRFEFELNLFNNSNLNGAFLDLETYKKYVQGNFYSSLYIERLYYLNSLSSQDAVFQFSQDIKPRSNKDSPGFSKNLKLILKQDKNPLTKAVLILELIMKITYLT